VADAAVIMNNPTSISIVVHQAGQRLASMPHSSQLSAALNETLRNLLTWPFCAATGFAGSAGERTEQFGSLVYVSSGSPTPGEAVEVPADNLACVIDVNDRLDLAALRLAYERVARAKRLQKTPPARLPGVPHSTVTLGLIVARETDVALESLAEELERLNGTHPDREWPDMAAVLGKGVIHYAVQFPATKIIADYLPPAADATADRVPAMYVVMVVRPTADFTFNKVFAFLLGHLVFFSPGSNIAANYVTVLEGVPQQLLTMNGYQYNLSGQLVPVPREFYNDRLLPQRPYLIQDPNGQTLSYIQFVPWQDGGVVMLRGKLPLEGLLAFMGKEVIARAGKINQPPDLQISYVLPIKGVDFQELLSRIQNQSNMRVLSDPTELVVKKFADEGSRTPFFARIFMGIARLRDAVFPGAVSREQFDKAYEFVMMSLLNARNSAKEIRRIIDSHVNNVANGKVARVRGPNIEIDENVDTTLQKEVDNFSNLAVRVLKHGMQQVTGTLQVDIGYLFNKQNGFEEGHAKLVVADGPLAAYILESRKWTEPLVVDWRNAIEHQGWMLPKFTYSRTPDGGVSAKPPDVLGQPVLDVGERTLDRLCCFVEDVTAHCLQQKMPDGISVTEVRKDARLVEMPERFRLTLRNGGAPIWSIAFHLTTFDET
jgi:hypothetical protein